MTSAGWLVLAPLRVKTCQHAETGRLRRTVFLVCDHLAQLTWEQYLDLHRGYNHLPRYSAQSSHSPIRVRISIVVSGVQRAQKDLAKCIFSSFKSIYMELHRSVLPARGEGCYPASSGQLLQ